MTKAGDKMTAGAREALSFARGEVGEKTYRYVAKDGRYRTRWRKVPTEGVKMPSKRTAAKLGEGYSMHVRTRTPRLRATSP